MKRSGSTGVIGGLANTAAITLFIRSPKVFKVVITILFHVLCMDILREYTNKCLSFFVLLKSLQFRTPINWLLMNLSFTELIIILTGNVTLTTNAYYRSSSIIITIIITITISVFNFMINS